jgi:hypothetical protein
MLVKFAWLITQISIAGNGHFGLLGISIITDGLKPSNLCVGKPVVQPHKTSFAYIGTIHVKLSQAAEALEVAHASVG